VTTTDVATLLAIVVVGPWGLVLAIALLRGYSISIRLWRRRQREQPRDDSEQAP
jgi:predicted PurR-regulated permease PerM